MRPAEDVSQYLESYWGEEAAQYGEEIYNTVTFDPGNYSAYCIGSIEFMELRKKAEQALDDQFDAKSSTSLYLRQAVVHSIIG